VTIIQTEGWVCCHCGEPVELVHPGAWWRHVTNVNWTGGACGFRLMDDAYNPDKDYYYQREEDDE
jgi:hypothetical protein